MVTQLSKKSPHLLWSLETQYCIHRSLSPLPILSQINAIQTILAKFLAKIYSNIKLPFKSGYSAWFLSCTFLNRHIACVILSHEYYLPPSIQSDNPNNICWSVQDKKNPYYTIFPNLYSLPRFKYSPHYLVFRHLQSCVLPLPWQTTFHTHRKQHINHILISVYLNSRHEDKKDYKLNSSKHSSSLILS